MKTPKSQSTNIQSTDMPLTNIKKEVPAKKTAVKPSAKKSTSQSAKEKPIKEAVKNDEKPKKKPNKTREAEEAENVSTIQRILHMLRFLPYIPNDQVESNYKVGKTTNQILNYLESIDFPTSIRTVQRDLSRYSISFPITERKNHWYWSADPYGLSGLPDSDVLTLHLLEKNLKALLPIQFFKGLSSRFNQAEDHLAFMEEGNEIRRWSEKVRYVSPNLNMLPPKISKNVHENVQKALFYEKQLQIDYQSVDSESIKSYQLHPLGLVQNGNLLYLVALHEHYLAQNEPRLYALHRMKSAVQLEQKSIIRADFNLDNYINEGAMVFAAGVKIELQARISNAMLKYISETPLSEDQTIEEIGDSTEHLRYLLKATVFDSWRLHWWLLSYTADICVDAPISLRNTLINNLKKGLANYDL